MKTRHWNFVATTAEEAVRKGLKKLGFSRDCVDVEVLGEKRSGLFSLFGYKKMEVKLTEKPAMLHLLDDDRSDRWNRPSRRSEGPRDGKTNDRSRRDRDDRNRPSRKDEPRRNDRSDRPRGDRNERNRRGPEDRARERNGRPNSNRRDQPRRESPRQQRPQDNRPEGPRPEAPSPDILLAEWKSLLGWDDLSWTLKTNENGDMTVLFSASSADRLTNPSDAALEALDHLIHVARFRGDRDIPRVSLEIEGRPKPGDRRLLDEAMSAAAEVKRTGQPFRMAPMPPKDRRAVHQALANHPDVVTASEGEGPFRKVVVKPK
jgi:spoIIIJ-associated protein